MSDTLKVFCRNIGRYIPITGGMTLADIYTTVSHLVDITPVCARVNNKTEDLSFKVFAPKMVEFLPLGDPASLRCYIRSLCMVLYKAVTEKLPGARLVMEHAVSSGYYFRILGVDIDPAVTAPMLRETIAGIVARDIPFERKERLTTDVIQIFKRQGLYDKAKLLESLHELYTVYYRLDGICDSYIGNLVPSTGMLSTFDLIPYEEGFLLLGPDPADISRVATPIPQPKLYRAFTDYVRFNNIMGIHNAGDVNAIVEQKSTSMMINVAEALHTKYIGAIADDITARYRNGGSRVVLIAGPSSSGKTTFTKRLAVQLLTNLIRPVMISLDDYFVNRDVTPRDETGDYDFESLYALDLPLFNDHLNRLIAGEEIDLPTYNFELGCRQYNGNRICLTDNTILLIEGIHGLNPELTRLVDEKMKYRIYVSALTTLSIDDHNWMSTTDNRLLRRIIRDYKYRGTPPLETIRRWPSVRRGEQKWIFPYQENADSMFNSSLLFEMGVMKEEADNVLRSVPRDTPEYAQAYRLRRILACFLPIPAGVIPPTSLLREFLGGSSFHY